MKICEAVARAISIECNGAPIFSLIGDANLPIVGALALCTDNLQCFARDEGAAVAMADGYAQSTGRIGIATVTSGPGLTHAATSLLGASRIRTPLVVVAGDTSMSRPAGLQEMQSFDQRHFAEACEANFHGLRSGASVGEDIAAAFYRARNECKPVVLSVPLDLQSAEVSDDWVYEPLPYERPRLEPDRRAVVRALEILNAAKYPLIVAGRGAVRSGARDNLLNLGDRIGAVFGTTLLGRGLFDASPWNIGVVGGFTSPTAMDAIRKADLIIAFGADLGHFTTQAGTLLRDRSVIRVDIAPFTRKQPLRGSLELQADADETAAALCDGLKGQQRAGFRVPEMKALLATPSPVGPTPKDGSIDPRQLMYDLGPALPVNTQVVVGGGHFFAFPSMFLPQPREGSFFCPLGAAAIGQALPCGIGVALGGIGTQRPTLVVEGDGSLLMNIQELETAARHRLPIVLVVMNDGALTAEVVRLGALGYDPNLAVYPTPDFAAVARGFGWKAIRIDGRDKIGDILSKHAWQDGPLLIDARISRDVVIDSVSVKDLTRRM